MFCARHSAGCWKQSKSSCVSLRSSLASDSSTEAEENHAGPSGGPWSRLGMSCRLLQLGVGWRKVNSFPRAALTKYHKLFSLKCQKLILSQFWSLAVWNSVGGLVLSAGERNHPWQSPSFWCCGNLRLSLACRYTTPASAATLIGPSSLCFLFLSYKDVSLIGFRSPIITSIKNLLPHMVTLRGSWWT